MPSRSEKPWEAVQASPNLRQEFTQHLVALGMSQQEIDSLLAMRPNGLRANYAREMNREG